MRRREIIKTFDEYWEEVKALGAFPNTAIMQIPEALKFQTKMKLIEKTPQETAQIIQEAVNRVDGGSTKKLDTLVRELLEMEQT